MTVRKTVANTASRRLVERLFDGVFNEHRWHVADEIFAEQYVEHATEPFGRQEPGLVDGPSHQRTVVEWLPSQFPDLRMTILALAADGDLVVARVRSEGTNLGSIGGVVPPTGNRFLAEQSHWYRSRTADCASTGRLETTYPPCCNWAWSARPVEELERRKRSDATHPALCARRTLTAVMSHDLSAQNSHYSNADAGRGSREVISDLAHSGEARRDRRRPSAVLAFPARRAYGCDT
jgi:predicted SnoaL-like aldol condensation-catalyzing enzyme